MKKIVLIGGGGYCSGVLDSLEKMEGYEVIGITDPLKEKETLFSKIPILGDDSCLKSIFKSGVNYAHITVGAVGDFALREKLINLALDIGFDLVSIIDPSAQVSKFARIGEMVYLGKNSVVNSNVSIGDYCMINTSSVIEHGCKLGNHVHIAPCSALAGDISIGDYTHIGINATVIQGLHIGNHCMIGAGSIVLSDVPDNKKVYGIVKKS